MCKVHAKLLSSYRRELSHDGLLLVSAEVFRRTRINKTENHKHDFRSQAGLPGDFVVAVLGNTKHLKVQRTGANKLYGNNAFVSAMSGFWA